MEYLLWRRKTIGGQKFRSFTSSRTQPPINEPLFRLASFEGSSVMVVFNFSLLENQNLKIQIQTWPHSTLSFSNPVLTRYTNPHPQQASFASSEIKVLLTRCAQWCKKSVLAALTPQTDV